MGNTRSWRQARRIKKFEITVRYRRGKQSKPLIFVTPSGALISVNSLDRKLQT
jgi:hypothetical protein